VIFTLGTFGAPITSLAAPVESNEREITVTAYADEGTPPIVLVRTEGQAGKGDGRSVRMTRMEAQGSGDAKQRAWLGVSIGEMPEVLAAQLSIKGRGVLISNVVMDSPADKAEFQAHDVILSVNGEPVDGDVRAGNLIQSRKPGETVSFVVLRNGEETTLTATLGSWPGVPEGPSGFVWKMKYKTAPDAEVTEHIKTRGKFIRRGPGGEWILKDLGNLENLTDMPENIRVFVPRGGERSTQVTVEGGVKTIRTKVEYDGSTILVEQKDDGPITVRRTDEDGKETVASYDDEDALRAADEEVFMIFDEAGKVEVTKLKDGATVDGDFDFDVDFGNDVWKNAMLEWRTKLDGTLGEAHEAYAKAMEEVHATWEKLKSEGWKDDQKQRAELYKLMHPGTDGSAGTPMAMAFAHAGKPRNSFEVRTDGTIEVRVRKGDSELVQLYKNESDLQQRNAELYEKYQELKSIKE